MWKIRLYGEQYKINNPTKPFARRQFDGYEYLFYHRRNLPFWIIGNIASDTEYLVLQSFDGWETIESREFNKTQFSGFVCNLEQNILTAEFGEKIADIKADYRDQIDRLKNEIMLERERDWFGGFINYETYEIYSYLNFHKNIVDNILDPPREPYQLQTYIREHIYNKINNPISDSMSRIDFYGISKALLADRGIK